MTRIRIEATVLMPAAEASAQEHARTLLVLDTAVEDVAAALHARLGFVLAGIIPEYALKPHG